MESWSSEIVRTDKDARPASVRTAQRREKRMAAYLGFGKVLIVDDNDFEQLRAAMLSSDLGATVEVASSGRSALSILESSQDVRLVLMDCDMPEMSGLEAARQWRAIERRRRFAIPIIGLSRDAGNDYARCIAAGMNACLSKPLRREDMARCFARWMETAARAKPVAPSLCFEG